MAPRRLSVLALLLGVVALVLALAPRMAQAQVFFSNTRVGQLVQYHTTVGTTAALAIPGSSVSSNLIGWRLCNDAVNSSTYLYMGKASDPSTDGVQLAPGSCSECPNCTASSLKAVMVKAQAAANGYSVLQYKQQ